MTKAVASILKSKVDIATQKYVSIDAYFRAEEKSLTKNEYHDGIILPMAGANLKHNLLSQKVGAIMTLFVEDNELSYKVSNCDTKIRIEDFNKIVYPDAVVICETPQYYKNREDTITNPLLVVEVLSNSTSKFDRTTKFEYYRTLESFKEYVLIYQDRTHIAVWTKQENGAWLPVDYKGEESSAILHSIKECTLSLKRLFKGI
jgi:Uma2 family endonuclease